jgi:small subunit ribosomal protein S4
MKIGPKYKIAKRLGAPVFEKTQTQKFAVSEARGARMKKGGRPGGASDYKKQHIEKQKMRFVYGITEKQLRRYVDEALLRNTAPIADLVGRLESRLDNVVHRLGLAKTRRLARQIVSHGHITVNGRRLNIPSHKVKIGDVIAVREQSKQSPLFAGITESLGEHKAPTWLTLDSKKFEGTMKSVPPYEPTETMFDPQQVLEFYSR